MLGKTFLPPMYRCCFILLPDIALSAHSICYLLKPGNVSAHHQRGRKALLFEFFRSIETLP